MSSEISVTVETSDLFKLFVGQIPKDMDEISLRPFFEEFGPIVEISIIRDNMTMMSKGCAFVTYSFEHSAQMAVDKLHDKVQLPNAMNALQVRFAETQIDRDNKLFIGMLPKTMVEQDLHDLFSIYGELREVHVIRGPEGGAKGCAFVKFVEREAALAAIENLNDTIPTGATRPLVVKFADGKKSTNKEEPWQLPIYRAQPMGAPISQSIPGQGRMLYPYPSLGQPVQSSLMVSAPSGYQTQASLGGQQRFSYVPSSTNSVDGYYHSSGDGTSKRDIPGFNGAADGQYGAKLSADSDFPSRPSKSGSDTAYEPSIEVLPPPVTTQQQAYPTDSDSSHIRPPEGPSGANLFIYHLPRDLTDADLATLFAPFGNVISAKVFVDKKTSDSKGFGFVSYDSMENANSAIESMNGFQIGSKRLKVQHKRVMGSPTPQYAHQSVYGSVGMPTHQPTQQLHMGHHQQQYHSQMQQQTSPFFRSSPMSVASPGGMMMSTQQSQYAPPGGVGMFSAGTAPSFQQVPMRGSTGIAPMGLPTNNRMQPTTVAPLRSPYNYPSYPQNLTYPQTAQPQRAGIMLPTQHMPGGGARDMLYSTSGGMPQQQPLSSYVGPDQQQPQQITNQSSLGTMSYMDVNSAANGSKPQSQQPSPGNNGVYFGQY